MGVFSFFRLLIDSVYIFLRSGLALLVPIADARHCHVTPVESAQRLEQEIRVTRFLENEVLPSALGVYVAAVSTTSRARLAQRNPGAQTS